MKPYHSMENALAGALALARGMSYKYVCADKAQGGGKAVIALPPDLKSQARADLLRRYGLLLFQLGGMLVTGPDVSTSSAPKAARPMCLVGPLRRKVLAIPGPATALGVVHGMDIVCEYLFGDASLAGRGALRAVVGRETRGGPRLRPTPV